MFCSVLFCSVLFCSVLFCSVLCSLFCSVVFCSLLCSAVFCSVLFCCNIDCWRGRAVVTSRRLWPSLSLRFQDLRPASLLAHLQASRSATDGVVGCLNEPQRVLSGFSDEALVSPGTGRQPAPDRTTAPLFDHVDSITRGAVAAATRSNLEQCVVCLSHEPCACAVLLRHFLPWSAPAAQQLEQASPAQCLLHNGPFTGSGTCDPGPRLEAQTEYADAQGCEGSTSLDTALAASFDGVSPRALAELEFLTSPAGQSHRRQLDVLLAEEYRVFRHALRTHASQWRAATAAASTMPVAQPPTPGPET